MEVVSKPCHDRFLHPVLVHYRKKNTGSQMGHTKKIFKKKVLKKLTKIQNYGFREDIPKSPKKRT